MKFNHKKKQSIINISGLTYPIINPVALSIGPVKIHWYGLAYLFGIASGIELAKRLSKKIKFETNISDFTYSIVMGIILGGRLGFVIFYDPIYYLNNPLEIFSIWKGGMSFHGGAFGAFFGAWIFCKKNKLSIRKGLDLLALCATPGLFFGRIANFINGELYGRPTDFFLGIVFPNGGHLMRHPSQLYEAFFEGICLFFILFFISKRFYQSGRLFTVFVFMYAIFRFFIEFTREPDTQLGYLFLDLSMGQYLSCLMVVFGLWWIQYEKNI